MASAVHGTIVVVDEDIHNARAAFVRDKIK
jgi:hypothetical protein